MLTKWKMLTRNKTRQIRSVCALPALIKRIKSLFWKRRMHPHLYHLLERFVAGAHSHCHTGQVPTYWAWSSGKRPQMFCGDPCSTSALTNWKRLTRATDVYKRESRVIWVWKTFKFLHRSPTVCHHQFLFPLKAPASPATDETVVWRI